MAPVQLAQVFFRQQKNVISIIKAHDIQKATHYMTFDFLRVAAYSHPPLFSTTVSKPSSLSTSQRSRIDPLTPK